MSYLMKTILGSALGLILGVLIILGIERLAQIVVERETPVAVYPDPPTRPAPQQYWRQPQ